MLPLRWVASLAGSSVEGGGTILACRMQVEAVSSAGITAVPGQGCRLLQGLVVASPLVLHCICGCCRKIDEVSLSPQGSEEPKPNYLPLRGEMHSHFSTLPDNYLHWQV